MDPRKVFGIAGAVMVVSLLGLYLTGFPLILAPVLSIGITFAVAAWVQMQKYYPGQNAKCAYGTILTLLPTLVALWVVQQAGGLASQLATKRLDSDIRTEIAAMLRDKPEDYPPLGEGLRQERLARLIEVRNNPNLSPRTAEFAEKATDYLENKLPQERGFRYRIATEARLRDAVIATETDPPRKSINQPANPTRGPLGRPRRPRQPKTHQRPKARPGRSLVHARHFPPGSLRSPRGRMANRRHLGKANPSGRSLHLSLHPQPLPASRQTVAQNGQPKPPHFRHRNRSRFRA